MMLKRCFDLFGAFVGIVLLLPVFFVLIAVVYWCLGAPVFFKQRRPGLNGVLFDMVKFRTMLEAFDADGTPLSDGDRLTRLGVFLRRSSLDELPSLISVLKGDMSLVGPRPLLAEYMPLYNEEQARRHNTLPGVTGWAQVNGRNTISWEEKFKFDIWYVDNQTFILDLKIILKTFIKVFKKSDISASGHATMPNFEGSWEQGDL